MVVSIVNQRGMGKEENERDGEEERGGERELKLSVIAVSALI